MTDAVDPPPVPILRQKCPNCRKTATLKYKPFCSKRCADVDLGRWLNEEYRVPVEEGINLDDEGYDDDL